MNNLPQDLRIKAGMIEMCERITFGSDSTLMRQAADRIEELEAHIKTASRAGFIAGVKWFQTETGYKSLNTAADEYSAGKPL